MIDVANAANPMMVGFELRLGIDRSPSIHNTSPSMLHYLVMFDFLFLSFFFFWYPLIILFLIQFLIVVLILF